MKKFLALLSLTMIALVLASCSSGPTCPEEEPTDLEAMYHLSGNYYQVFVRSFADGSGDGIGDFIGIKENLDYFETLGIDGLWLMPIHPTTSKHGYDVLDYYDVNPEYGTMADFEALLDAANARGITIIIDFVLNHTSDQHPWFQAFLDGESPYDDYYRRIDADDPRLDSHSNLWHALGDGTYYAGYFGGYMPDLNWSNPEVQDEMVDIATFWMDKGVGGFRLDAALHLQSVGEVPAYYNVFDENMFELAYWEGRVKEAYPEAYIVGEIWESFNVYNRFYEAIDSPLHFEFGHHVVNAIRRGHNDAYVDTLIHWHQQAKEAANGYRDYAVEAPFLRNHDQNRIASSASPGTPNLGDNHEKLRLAAEMLLTAPGNPFIYYGEELGMKGEAWGNPPIWDESIRLPFLWNNAYQATWPIDDWGFEDPYNDDVNPVSVQKEDADSLFNVYRRLLNLRQDSWALKYGTIYAYEESDRYLQGFYRILDVDQNHQDIVLVLHNLSDDIIPLFDYDLPEEILYYTEYTFDQVMAPRSTLIFQIDPNESDLISDYED